MSTQEFSLGFEPMAEHFRMLKKPFGNGKHFGFKEESSGGWFTQIHAAEGLFISSMWFTPQKALSYTMDIPEPCMWIFGIDCGDIIFTQNGKPARHLTSTNQIVLNPQKPFRITFPADIHVCCTCILVFEEFFNNFPLLHKADPPLKMDAVPGWTDRLYDTAEFSLILEQIKWAARNGVMPLFYYECKFGELMSVVLKNAYTSAPKRPDRRYHITWENEQKIARIKAQIDTDALNAPPVETLAMSEAMSVSKLHRCFKQYCRTTLVEYIRTAKIRRSLLMLAADELSITNIAHQCGYESTGKFTRAFKKVFQTTPREYRKAYNL